MNHEETINVRNIYRKIDDKLYYAKYRDKKIGNPEEIWDSIKNNKELIKWAIKPTKDKFGQRDLVNGLAICENMLIYYNSVDSELYHKLVDLIYSNKQIARIVLDGYANGGNSYLLMTLWNQTLTLTEYQKNFAVDEAMNIIGTVRYENNMREYSKQLDEMGISDDQTIYTEFGGSINPVGAKTGNMYIAELFGSLSDTQAHGRGDYDIRYWILRNKNWSLEEKQNLIMNFWYCDDTYDELLEQWEWNVVNDNVNFKGNSFSLLDKDKLYTYTYDELLKFYNDQKTTDRIWEEIQFCKQMHQLRPQQRELDYIKPRVLEKVAHN